MLGQSGGGAIRQRWLRRCLETAGNRTAHVKEQLRMVVEQQQRDYHWANKKLNGLYFGQQRVAPRAKVMAPMACTVRELVVCLVREAMRERETVRTSVQRDEEPVLPVCVLGVVFEKEGEEGDAGPIIVERKGEGDKGDNEMMRCDGVQLGVFIWGMRDPVCYVEDHDKDMDFTRKVKKSCGCEHAPVDYYFHIREYLISFQN